MTDIDDSEYIEERREEIASALEAEGLSQQVIEDMDPDDVLDEIAEALIRHDVPERHIDE